MLSSPVLRLLVSEPLHGNLEGDVLFIGPGPTRRYGVPFLIPFLLNVRTPKTRLGLSRESRSFRPPCRERVDFSELGPRLPKPFVET